MPIDQGRVRQYAVKLWQAMGQAYPKIDEATKTLLDQHLFDADVRWGLALVLALWDLGNIDEPYHQALVDAGGKQVLEQLKQLAALMPNTFKDFLSTTRAAKEVYQLAGSAVYFGSTIRELSLSNVPFQEKTQLRFLHDWLRGPAFSEPAKNLIKWFPAPESKRQALPMWGTSAPNTRSRGERFDRADFERPKYQRLSAASPVLSAEEVSRLHLASLGWDEEAIERTFQRAKKS